MAHIDDATLIAKTRNLARYFTEQRQVAWVALVGTILWGVIGYFEDAPAEGPRHPGGHRAGDHPLARHGRRADRGPGHPADRGRGGREQARGDRPVGQPDQRLLRLRRAQGGDDRDRRDLRRHRPPAQPDPGSAPGRRADPVHQGLRQHRGADAHGGEPTAGGGAGLAPCRPGAGRDRAAPRGGVAGEPGVGGVQLPALDLRGERGPAGAALPGAGGGRTASCATPGCSRARSSSGWTGSPISPTRRSSPTCTASFRGGFGPPSSTRTPGSRPSCATRRRPGRGSWRWPGTSTATRSWSSTPTSSSARSRRSRR